MPSDPTPPDLPRDEPRRPSRLEQRCNGPRCLGPFLLICALTAGNGCVVLFDAGVHRVAVTMLTLVAALAGLRTLRTGTRPPFVACLVLTALLVVVWHLRAAQTTQVGWIGALTIVVDVYAVGLGVAFALLALRLLSPLKAAVLAFSTASAIAIGAVAFEVRDAGRGGSAGPRPDEPPSPLAADREFFVPNELTWLGMHCRSAPGIEYDYHPNILIKTCYPDNPRGYFEVGEIYGLQDMRAAFLNITPPASATLRPTRQRSGTIRVEPTTCDPQAAWRISVEFQDIPVRAGVRYTVTGRARADREKSVWLSSSEPTDVYVPSGLAQAITLTRDWREFSAVFLATRTSNKNVISFQIGRDNAAVEFAAFAVHANTPQAVAMEPDRWRVARVGATAAPPLSHTAAQVRLDAAPGRIAGVERDLFPLAKGAEYEFSLRARADGSLPGIVAVGEADDPATNLGHASTLALTKEWQWFGARFCATRDGKRPVFVLGAADATFGFEIAEFQFTSYEHGPVPLVPQRYTVDHQLNGEGFRDRDHPLAKEPGTYRIACLGDSFTFGQGVHEQDTFVRRIEDALAGSKTNAFEVMNFGRCGYCTRQERACYEQSAAKYEPDLVLVTMVPNDNLSGEDEKRLGFFDKPVGGALMQQVYHQLELTYEKVGYDGCVKELLALRELCRQQGARMAVVLFLRACETFYTEKMGNTIRAGLKDTDIPILDLAETFRTIPYSVQTVHASDGHPNELAHRLAAERIVEFLRREVLEKAK